MGHLNMNILSYQYTDSRDKDKTVYVSNVIIPDSLRDVALGPISNDNIFM